MQGPKLDDRDWWFVAVPHRAGESLPGFRDIQGVVSKLKAGACSPVELPDLRIGTLDALMSLSDDLVRHDQFVANVCSKLARQLLELSDEEGQDLEDKLMVGAANLSTYMKKFRWIQGRWDYQKNSLQAICEEIQRTMSEVDDQLRVRQQDWSVLMHSISAADRRETGSILLRDLSSLVKEEDFIESEYVTTLLVVVPKFELKNFFACYETLSDMVVPRSAKQIAEDNENALFSVFILKAAVDDFKAGAREHKFTPREFSFKKGGAQERQEHLQQLSREQEVKKLELQKFAKTNFSEAFTSWVHIKCIRTWVEAVLRYGLPAQFHVAVIEPKERSKAKLLTHLDNLFSSLGNFGGGDVEELEGAAPVGIQLGDSFHPYVFQEMCLHF